MSWVKLIPNVAALALLLLPSVVQAQLVRNYSIWKGLSAAGKANYAAGIFDALTLPREGDPVGIALSAALVRCAVDLKLNSALVAEALTRHWEQHSESWGDTAATIFFASIARSVCLKHVNEERRKVGLVEWTKD